MKPQLHLISKRQGRLVLCVGVTFLLQRHMWIHAVSEKGLVVSACPQGVSLRTSLLKPLIYFSPLKALSPR